MKPRCIHPRYRHNTLFAAVLSFIANAVLALLILFRTPPELRRYSQALLCRCGVEAVFATTCLVVDSVGVWHMRSIIRIKCVQHLSFRSDILFVVIDGFHCDSHDVNFSLVMLQIYMIYVTLAMSAIPLVLRYFSVCK